MGLSGSEESGSSHFPSTDFRRDKFRHWSRGNWGGGRARVLAVMVSGSAEVPLLRFAQFTPIKIGDREMGCFRSTKIVQVGCFSLTPALSRWERG